MPFPDRPRAAESDRRVDVRRQPFIAEGNVRLLLNGVLQADRLEFDSDFNSLLPEAGSAIAKALSISRPARCDWPGAPQRRQGGRLRVLDLDSAAGDFNPFPSNPLAGDTSRRDSVSPRSQNPARLQALLLVIERSGLVPTSIDIELSSTANRISPQGIANFWKPSSHARNGWAVPTSLLTIQRQAIPWLAQPCCHRFDWFASLAVTACTDDRLHFRRHVSVQRQDAPEYLLGVSL